MTVARTHQAYEDLSPEQRPVRGATTARVGGMGQAEGRAFLDDEPIL